MPINIDQLLESITEAIRCQRRNGVRGVTNRPMFPTPWDLSSIKWDTEHRRIEFDLMEDGHIRKFDMLLDEVASHGETSIVDEGVDSEPVDTTK